jgi:PKD repeat protein
MKKIFNLLLIIALCSNAKAQITIDSTNIGYTCLDCDSIGVVPLPNSYGSLHIEVSGGVAPYFFSLTGDLPANLTPVNIVSSLGVGSYSQLCQDTFQLAITDNNGASTVFYFSTVPPLPPTFNIDSVSVLPDSTSNPDSGVIELHVTTNADSIFYKIKEQNNAFPLGSLGGWQNSTIFDSLPGGYSYKVYIDIYPKVLSCGTGQLDTGSTVLLIYVPLACENDGGAGLIVAPNACVGEVVNVDAYSFAGSGVNNFVIAENFGLGDGFNTPGPAPFTHIYTQPGTFWIDYLVMTSHGCQFYYTVPITINPLPVVNFIHTDNGAGLFSFIDGTSGVSISNWDWDFGDGNNSNSQSPNHQYSITGTYTVCLTVTSTGGCIDVICQSVTYSIATTLDQLNTKNGISIYPNPTNGIFTIALNSISTNASIVVYTVVGKEVINQQLTNTTTSIDLTKFDKGIYFVRIQNRDQLFTQRIIKQ